MIFIGTIAFSILACMLTLTALRTPIWMVVWFLILGISLYFLPGPAKVAAPVVIAISLFIKKGLYEAT